MHGATINKPFNYLRHKFSANKMYKTYELHEFNSILLVYVLDGNEDNPIKSYQVPCRERTARISTELNHVF